MPLHGLHASEAVYKDIGVSVEGTGVIIMSICFIKDILCYVHTTGQGILTILNRWEIASVLLINVIEWVSGPPLSNAAMELLHCIHQQIVNNLSMNSSARFPEKRGVMCCEMLKTFVEQLFQESKETF